MAIFDIINYEELKKEYFSIYRYKTLSECYPELSIDFKIDDTVDIIHKLLRLIARDYELEQEEKKNKEEE